MSVRVETLGPCKKLLHFELDAETVEKAFEEVSQHFLKHAKVPGFRPGKAPKQMVLSRFQKEIQEETKKKLINDAYSAAEKEHELDIVTYPQVEDAPLVRGQSFQFAVTVETAPEFEMPKYRGLSVKRGPSEVSDQDVERALEALRHQRASYDTVVRPVQEGDFVVVTYKGFCDGTPIAELAPSARAVAERTRAWVEVKQDSFLPGFATQLIGARAGERRRIEVVFPPDFPVPELISKSAVYEVEIVEVKEKKLPPLDDEFAKSFEAENMAKLREGVRRDLQNELNQKQRRSLREQVLRGLLQQVECDLPETIVQHETRRSVYDIVADLQRQGATKEVIDQRKDEIYDVANRTAATRVKLMFIIRRIAEKEGITVSRQELDSRLVTMARNSRMDPRKFAKEIQEKGMLEDIYNDLLQEKVLSFLIEHAQITDVPAEEVPA